MGPAGMPLLLATFPLPFSLTLALAGRTAMVLVLRECLKMSLHIVQNFLTQFCCRNCLAGCEEGVPQGMRVLSLGAGYSLLTYRVRLLYTGYWVLPSTDYY